MSIETPNFFIEEIVASRYGFDTNYPSMFNVIPFSVFGAVIIKAEMNWLDTEPGIVTSPPRIFPCIVIGGFPPVEEHFAPIDCNASSNNCIGLFRRLESPSKVTLSSESDEIAAAILIVVPEFEASMLKLCNFISPELSIVKLDPSMLIFAPKFLHAFIVAMVSLESKTLFSLL